MSQLLARRRSPEGAERWDPADLEQASERIRQMLEQTFAGSGLRALVGEMGIWTPPVDIEEEDDAYVIEAELPGVRREDVNIELAGNELVVTGELKKRERKGILRRETRRTGSFALRVALPEPVDADKVEANIERGVLTVRVPKASVSQRRRIEIKS
jgi:HSP20 family protein